MTSEEKKKYEIIRNDIMTELVHLKMGEYYHYHSEIAPYTIDAVLDMIIGSKTSSTNILGNVNGCDMDWSLIDDITLFYGKKYHVWGCVASGSLNFQRKS
jgi:hypothetical protein